MAEGASADDVTTATGDEPPEAGLPLDIIFDMLKNRRRRLVLEYVSGREGPFSLRELAEHIAAIENDKPIRALRSDERKRVYVGLYQCHLPRMDDAGVVDFDSDRGVVTVGPNIADLETYLAVGDGDSRDAWPRYYLALAAVGAAVTTTSLIGVLPVTWYSTVVMPAYILAVGSVAIAHELTVRRDSSETGESRTPSSAEE